jgi:tRNA threonylcarbamoyladenosine biosynthesis protein TsaB
MLLLVADTSGRNGSVALARAQEESSSHEVQLIESAPLAGGTFSALLVPQIAGLLEKHGFRKSDIGAFIVVSGPGSFTGLRVGLAAIKALAEVFQKPIVPVSLLEVVACASGAQGSVLAALDAGRGEVYGGSYQVEKGTSRMMEERVLPRNEFVSLAQNSVVVTPDPNLASEAKSGGASVVELEAIRAEMIARLGWEKLRSGNVVSPEQLEANYVRRTDAEIFVKPASSS